MVYSAYCSKTGSVVLKGVVVPCDILHENHIGLRVVCGRKVQEPVSLVDGEYRTVEQ